MLALPVRLLKLLAVRLEISSHIIRNKRVLYVYRGTPLATGCIRLSAWCRRPMFPIGIRHRTRDVLLQPGELRRNQRDIAVFSIDQDGLWRLSHFIYNGRIRDMIGSWSAQLVSTAPTALPTRQLRKTPFGCCRRIAQMLSVNETNIPKAFGALPVSLVPARIPTVYRMHQCRWCICLQDTVSRTQKEIITCPSADRRLSVRFRLNLQGSRALPCTVWIL